MSDRDPRNRRRGDYQPGRYVAGGHPLPPRPDPLAAAVALDVATESWRVAYAASRPDPVDDRDDQLADADDECQARECLGIECMTECSSTHRLEVFAAMAQAKAQGAVDDVPRDPVDGVELDPVDGLPVVDEDQAVDVDRGIGCWPPAAESWSTVADLQAELPQDLRSDPSPADLEAGNLPVWHRQLDWKSRHDPASLDYGVRALIRNPVPIVDLIRPHGPVLDQGSEGACVGFAAAAAANVLDLADGVADRPFAAADAARIYGRAKLLDHVPGEAYEGTSVLAGMLAGREAGAWAGFVWAFGTRDVAQAVLQVGPVIIGIPWLSGMYETGPGGLVSVTGKPVGGHSLTVVGIVTKPPRLAQRHAARGPWFVWQNSWGPTYGDGGLGYIHHADLAQLLRSVGEAAIPVGEAAP